MSLARRGMEATHAACTLRPCLHLPALWCAQASLLSELHHVRAVMRTFIDARRASVLSQSRATWTTRDNVGKLWLDCVMDRGRGTMTFFLVNWQLSRCQETSDKKRQVLLMKLLFMLQGQRQSSVSISVLGIFTDRPDIVWLLLLQMFVIIVFKWQTLNSHMVAFGPSCSQIHMLPGCFHQPTHWCRPASPSLSQDDTRSQGADFTPNPVFLGHTWVPHYAVATGKLS